MGSSSAFSVHAQRCQTAAKPRQSLLHASRFRAKRLTETLCAALASVAFVAPANAQEAMLDTVNVRDTRDMATLHLDQPTQSGNRTGVTAKELPASLEIVDSETMRERGDTQIQDAITRTIGLTDVSTPGSGGLSLSSRGFAGANSIFYCDKLLTTINNGTNRDVALFAKLGLTFI